MCIDFDLSTPFGPITITPIDPDRAVIDGAGVTLGRVSYRLHWHLGRQADGTWARFADDPLGADWLPPHAVLAIRDPGWPAICGSGQPSAFHGAWDIARADGAPAGLAVYRRLYAVLPPLVGVWMDAHPAEVERGRLAVQDRRRGLLRRRIDRTTANLAELMAMAEAFRCSPADQAPAVDHGRASVVVLARLMPAGDALRQAS